MVAAKPSIPQVFYHFRRSRVLTLIIALIKKSASNVGDFSDGNFLFRGLREGI